MSIKKKITLKKVLLVVLLLTPIVLYFLIFCDGFSYNHADWGAFGDYIGGVYSVIVALLLFFLTNKIENYRESRNVKKKAIEELYNYIVDVSEEEANENNAVKLRNLVNKNRLFISTSLYDRIIEFSDYYIELSKNRISRDPNRIDKILNDLICNYNNENL